MKAQRAPSSFFFVRRLALALANAPVWNSQVIKPVMYMSGYLVRRNRLGLSSGDLVPDSQATPLVATNASHPIFNGITFGGDGVTMANPYNTFIDRGTTEMGNLPAGGGTVLATNPAVASGVAIARWASGSTVQDERTSTTSWRGRGTSSAGTAVSWTARL